MKRIQRDLLVLFLLSLTTRLIVATFIQQPGYMDAAYYAAGAVRLAQGAGLTEPFLWNYLDDPGAIPRPGFLYWMPLPSLLGAPFAALFPGSFFALQIPFALLSALLPPLTYLVAWQATGRHRISQMAGLFTLFSGFFLPYWTVPETFAPFAIFGAAALWLAGKQPSNHPPLTTAHRLLVGVLIGLAHLTRSDGPVLLAAVATGPYVARALRGRSKDLAPRQPEVVGWQFGICDLALVLIGYLLTMAPWFVRNLSQFGLPLSPAGSKSVWLRTYDDLFCYDCDLSLRSYLAWGWPNILRSKLWAVGISAQRFLAENCLIFLLPFTLIGLYRLRRRPPFALSLVFLVLIYLAHSLAFTFPGPRGGSFHASAALLPFLHAAGAEGLAAAIGWAARRRRWNARQARTVLGTAAVLLAIFVSVQATSGKLAVWRTADAAYQELDAWLDAHDVSDDRLTMVGNPPGFWYHTHRPAVVVPNEDLNTLLEVCRRYGVDYLALDPNAPVPLRALYEGRTDTPGLSRVATLAGGQMVVWEVEREAAP